MFIRLSKQDLKGKGATPAKAAKGPLPLSPRQKQAHGLLLMGKSTREIALNLGIKKQTASMHVGKVFRKFGVKSKVELLAMALATARQKQAA